MKRLVLLTLLLFGFALAACPEGMDPHKARVVSVWDGDTLRADITLLGNLTLLSESVRLLDADAPERYQPGGLEARDHLEALLSEQITLCMTGRRGKYGRFSVVVMVDDENINDRMVQDGHAERKTYR